MVYEDDFRRRIKAFCLATVYGGVVAALLLGCFAVFDALSLNNFLHWIVPIPTFVVFSLAVYGSFRSNEQYFSGIGHEMAALTAFRLSGKEIVYFYAGIALTLVLAGSAVLAAYTVTNSSISGLRMSANFILLFGAGLLSYGFVTAGGITAGYVARKSDLECFMDRKRYEKEHE